MKDEIILYRHNQLAEHIEVRIDEEKETIWLTQQQIADLFGTQRPAITKHLGNIFKSGELDEKVVSSILEHTTKHGAAKGKTQEVKVKYYNIDVVLSVGYRVNSIRATQFRIWANNILKYHLLKGYTLNQRMNRIENTVENLADKVNRIDLQLSTHLIPTQGIFLTGRCLMPMSSLQKLFARQRRILKTFIQSHDRFLIIDGKEVYHLGASLKDLGRKWFAFSKLGKASVQSILNCIDKLL